MSAKDTFLSLPPEVRQCIYEYVLVASPYIDTASKPHLQISVQRICRQIYDEAFRVLYSKNIFYASDPIYTIQWLESMSSRNKKLIRHVHVRLARVEGETYMAWLSKMLQEFSTHSTRLRQIHLHYALSPRYTSEAMTEGQILATPFVRTLASISNLKEVILSGCYPEDWPVYLKEKSRASVGEEDRQSWNVYIVEGRKCYRRATVQGTLYDDTIPSENACGYLDRHIKFY